MTIRIKTDNNGRQVISSSNPVLVSPIKADTLVPVTDGPRIYHNTLFGHQIKFIERSVDHAKFVMCLPT